MFHVEQIKKNRIMKKICGNLILLKKEQIKPGCLIINDGIIKEIIFNENNYNDYILPGFIDSHVHIESSMLTPEKFSELTIKNGTVAVIADPHEIANVLGIKGIEFMIESAEKAKIKIFFMAPSCVPATKFETSGGEITYKDIEYLYEKYPNKILGLGEVMNYPGVIYGDKEMLNKLNITKRFNKRIDGHAPNLTGKDLRKYIDAGIETDHECSTLDEAIEKIKLGMKIQIREGSAARNFDDLKELINLYPDEIMFCTDDSHPDELTEKGEINKIVKLALKENYPLFNILKASSLNAIEHYNIPVGKLEVGDPADFIITDSLNSNFIIKNVYINGKERFNKSSEYEKDKNKIQHNINNFKANKITIDKLKLKCDENKKVKIIRSFDKSLLTETTCGELKCKNGELKSDIENDILKIAVINRYVEKPEPSIGFINGFNLKKGAIASSIAHDSHNIIAVGTNDEDLTNVINLIIENKGGLAVVNENFKYIIPLEIAGLMTNESGEIIANTYKEINKITKELGCQYNAPFMTLGFMALLVIPELKISDKGLFDNTKFNFTDLYC
jgi:adenine deaminase